MKVEVKAEELEALRRFVRMVYRWRRIPIIDEGFVESRDEVDRECNRLLYTQGLPEESDMPTLVSEAASGRDGAA